MRAKPPHRRVFMQQRPVRVQKGNGQWSAHLDTLPLSSGDRKWSPGQSPNKPHVFLWVSRLFN